VICAANACRCADAATFAHSCSAALIGPDRGDADELNLCPACKSRDDARALITRGRVNEALDIVPSIWSPPRKRPQVTIGGSVQQLKKRACECSAFRSNLFGLAQMIPVVRKLPSG
jgi:hypothetical protein